MKVVITGGCGLVGSACAGLFAAQGHNVFLLDNFYRAVALGPDADTKPGLARLMRQHPAIQHRAADVRDVEAYRDVIKGSNLVIHAAGQPSHSRSVEIPLDDFSVNANGTLALLESVRREAPDAVFIYCSTNKVYGDNPNRLPVVELETRFAYVDAKGVSESLSLDACVHTPFGISKLTGDLYTQEYANIYGLRTGCFRLSCVTGPGAAAVESHNWLRFLVSQISRDRLFTIFGYRGKQVRDVIDACDVAEAFRRFASAPVPGAVYNLGGGAANSLSIIEAMQITADLAGVSPRYRFDVERVGDHRVYITDLARFESLFGNVVSKDVARMVEEMLAFDRSGSEA